MITRAALAGQTRSRLSVQYKLVTWYSSRNTRSSHQEPTRVLVSARVEGEPRPDGGHQVPPLHLHLPPGGGQHQHSISIGISNGISTNSAGPAALAPESSPSPPGSSRPGSPGVDIPELDHAPLYLGGADDHGQGDGVLLAVLQLGQQLRVLLVAVLSPGQGLQFLSPIFS